MYTFALIAFGLIEILICQYDIQPATLFHASNVSESTRELPLMGRRTSIAEYKFVRMKLSHLSS